MNVQHATRTRTAPTPIRTPQRTASAVNRGFNIFTMLPNEYIEHLMNSERLSGMLQSNIVILLMRQTWSSAETKEWAKLSLAQIAKACGGDKSAVCRALADLVRREIVAQSDNGYKCTPERWATAAKYVLPKVEKQAVEPEEDTDAEEVASKNATRAKIVLPGKRTTCKARWTPKGKDPVDVPFDVENAGSQTLQFVSTDGERLSFRVGPVEAKSQSLYCNTTQTEDNTENKELSSLAAVICAISDSLPSPIDPRTLAGRKMLERIISAAGPDADPEIFDHLIRRRIADRTKKGTKVDTGLLPALAQDIRGQLAAMKPAAPQSKFADDGAWNAYLEDLKESDPEAYAHIMREASEVIQ